MEWIGPVYPVSEGAFSSGFLTEAFHEDRNELYYKPKLPDLKMQSDFYEYP